MSFRFKTHALTFLANRGRNGHFLLPLFNLCSQLTPLFTIPCGLKLGWVFARQQLTARVMEFTSLLPLVQARKGHLTEMFTVFGIPFSFVARLKFQVLLWLIFKHYKQKIAG